MAKKKTTKKAAKKTATRSPARKATAKKHTLSEMDKKTIALVERTALMVQRKIKASSLPELKFPVRSLANVTYDKKVGFFELGKGRKVRALSFNTVKTFAQTLRLMSVSKEMIENDDFAT